MLLLLPSSFLLALFVIYDREERRNPFENGRVSFFGLCDRDEATSLNLWVVVSVVVGPISRATKRTTFADAHSE